MITLMVEISNLFFKQIDRALIRHVNKAESLKKRITNNKI